MSEKPPVSGYVITYNEAHQLEACLERLAPFCSEVVVADMHSPDGTAKLAERLGAKVIMVERKGTPELVRDHVVAQLKHDWIFYVDADERLSAPMAQRIRDIMATNPEPGIYLVPGKLFIFGERVRHCGMTNYKGFALERRFFHRTKLMFGNGEKIHQSVISKVEPKPIWKSDEELEDLGFDHLWSPHINHYIYKMARYTNIEHDMNLKRGYHPKLYKLVTSPARDFFDRYIRQKGFLDGAIGFEFCLMNATYQFYRILKSRHPQHVGDII